MHGGWGAPHHHPWLAPAQAPPLPLVRPMGKNIIIITHPGGTRAAAPALNHSQIVVAFTGALMFCPLGPVVRLRMGSVVLNPKTGASWLPHCINLQD